MVEVVAATAGALLTACFVSVGSVSLRNRQQRDDLVRIQTSVEALGKNVSDVHSDVKDIYSRLRHVDIELAKLTKTQ